MKQHCGTCERKIDGKPTTLLPEGDWCGWCARPTSEAAHRTADMAAAKCRQVIEAFPLAL